MKITVSVDGRDTRDLEVFSEGALAEIFADEAEQVIDETTQSNRQITGKLVEPELRVDGREVQNLSSVTLRSEIQALYGMDTELAEWVREQLFLHSPKEGPPEGGHYRDSHVLFADGTLIMREQEIPPAKVYVFANTQPYAGKIERGMSSEAPDGVYQVVAVLAQRKFGDTAQISYERVAGITGVERSPAIRIVVN